MFQGTGSDVGKSLIVAGLCRALSNHGLRVRPFKPQNMSNNAAVTADGGEIGRAQALQALACRVAPSIHMNPVLLKPQSETGAQVVVLGRISGNASAAAFQHRKASLLDTILTSFSTLAADADIILVEGAGSAAEVNLRANDIANMGFARAADIPVVLIGDIDRGGVIAQIVGTGTVIDKADAALIRGFIVNKFRGDPALFRSGMEFITARTSWPGLGLVPYFREAVHLPAEDAMVLDQPRAEDGGPIVIAVPRLAHIANFDDLDPLRMEPAVHLVMVQPGEAVPGDADLVILPGAKATLSDLADFRTNGWHIDLHAHIRRGGRVLGICGGYQMLGQEISDPHAMEGTDGGIAGLGHLDVVTTLTTHKMLTAVEGHCTAHELPFRGYEMHIGHTTGPDCDRPMLQFADGRVDGAVSLNGRIKGTYVHGLFRDDTQRVAILRWAGGIAGSLCYDAEVDRILDRLADHLARHIDIDRLLKIAG
jgi:adenosylcobyric acid synthase